MNLPFESMKLKFGIHKNKEIKDIPDNYLKFLLSKNILKGKLLFHCQIRFNMPMKVFTVTVEDAVVGNGTYTVKAYNKQHALNICMKQNNIQCTQSYHGTSICIH